MKTLASITAFALLIILSSFCKSKSLESEQGKDDGGIKVPSGFTITVFVDKVGPARHIAINDNGNIYLALSSMKNGGGIAALRDSNGDGKADETKFFGKTVTTGIEMKDGFLYYSNSVEVYRVPISKDELVPSGGEQLIVSGFLKQNQHQDKTFALDNEGNIYINVGAPSNACQVKDRTPGSPGQDPCPLLERHAGIWKFRADKPGQDQMKDGTRYATGIRNAIAIAWNYSNNKLYVVQHGRDQLYQFYPNLYTGQQGAELPAEEFFQVNNGDNFGWPYCYYDQTLKQKVMAPEYGGDGKTKGRCTDAKDPILAFPGHLAPNDLLFYTGKMFPEKYRDGAFIAFHGSWNRAPLEQKGYFVVFVPFKNGLPSGDWEIFADGFAGVSPIMNMNDIKYRPMGLIQGPDGSLFISDSEEGRIWKVTYKGGK